MSELFEENLIPQHTWRDIFFPGVTGDTFNDIIRAGGSQLSSSGRMVGQIIEGTFLSRAVDGLILEFGSNASFRHGGNLTFTTVTAPIACVATLIEIGTGNVDNGTHLYKITYLNADPSSGETELGEVSNEVTVDASHKQVSLTNISISPSKSVTSKSIFRTKAGETVNFYYIANIPANQTTYTDNIADASLVYDIKYHWNDTFGNIYVNDVICANFGSSNTFLGWGTTSANLHASTYYNTGIGAGALLSLSTGVDNTAVGGDSGDSITTGSYNTLLGSFTGYNLIDGTFNVFLGYGAGYSNESGDNNVYIGKWAGYYQTGSNRLIIDNQYRADAAAGLAGALVVGTFADTPSSQSLRFNAGVLSLSDSGNISCASKTIYLTSLGNLYLRAGTSKVIYINKDIIPENTSVNLGTIDNKFHTASFSSYIYSWYSILPNTDPSYSSLGDSKRYWQYLWANYVKYKHLDSFQHHNDIDIIKDIRYKKITRLQVDGYKNDKPIKRNENVNVWDENTMPSEVYKDGFYDAGALQGLTIGTLKQLIEKVEDLEKQIDLLKNKK
jgi:hypothetical protein